MNFALDCSVAISWCFEDEADAWSDRILDSLSSATAFVPEIWHTEIANVLVQCERKKRLTEAQTAAFLRRLRSLPIQVCMLSRDENFSDVLHLARREGLTSYDAAYLRISLREGLPLATHDKALKVAAARLGVPLL